MDLPNLHYIGYMIGLATLVDAKEDILYTACAATWRQKQSSLDLYTVSNNTLSLEGQCCDRLEVITSGIFLDHVNVGIVLKGSIQLDDVGMVQPRVYPDFPLHLT